MWKHCGICNVLCIVVTIVYGHDFKSFDDTVLFKINWPGKTSSDLLVSIGTARCDSILILDRSTKPVHFL